MPSLVINLPGAIMPLERGEIFEDPLWDAFEAGGIEATITGGGHSLGEAGGRRVVTGCDITLEVADLAQALPVLRRVLIAQGGAAGHDDPTVPARRSRLCPARRSLNEAQSATAALARPDKGEDRWIVEGRKGRDQGGEEGAAKKGHLGNN